MRGGRGDGNALLAVFAVLISLNLHAAAHATAGSNGILVQIQPEVVSTSRLSIPQRIQYKFKLFQVAMPARETGLACRGPELSSRRALPAYLQLT